MAICSKVAPVGNDVSCSLIAVDAGFGFFCAWLIRYFFLVYLSFLGPEVNVEELGELTITESHDVLIERCLSRSAMRADLNGNDGCFIVGMSCRRGPNKDFFTNLKSRHRPLRYVLCSTCHPVALMFPYSIHCHDWN